MTQKNLQTRCRRALLLVCSVLALTCLAGCLMDNVAEASSGDDLQTSATSSVALYGDSTFVAKASSVLNGGKTTGSGKTYYVSTSGKDSASGSSSAPFKTISYAVKKLAAGDTLYVKGGTYKEAVAITVSGTASNYITISNAPGETVILDGSSMSGSDKTLLNISGSYLAFSGLRVQNLNGLDACGVNIAPGANGIILNALTVTGIKTPSPASDDHCANPIFMFGNSASKAISNVLVCNCTISDCATGWTEAISVTGNATNINVVRNTLSKTGNIGIDFSGNYGYCSDASKDFPRNCLAYGNTVTSCSSAYGDTAYGIYVDGGQNIVIDSNTVVSCDGGIEVGAEKTPPSSSYQTSTITVKNNTLTKNTDVGISIGGYKTSCGNVDKVVVQNNICQENGLDNGSILVLSKCSNITVQNNKFVSATSGGKAVIVENSFSNTYTKAVTFKGNLYYNGANENSTCFIYLKKEYNAFSKWVSATNDSNSTYNNAASSNSGSSGNASAGTPSSGNGSGTTTQTSVIQTKAVSLSSACNGNGFIIVRWKALGEASNGYRVYRKKGTGNWTTIATVPASTLFWRDTTVSNGILYTYTVRGIRSGMLSMYNSVGVKSYYLSPKNLKSASNQSSRKVKVSWSKSSGVTGYQLQYSTSKSFSNAKLVTVSKATATSKTLSKLTKKKTYYFRIRTYKKIGSAAYYGAWGSSKSVKIKK